MFVKPGPRQDDRGRPLIVRAPNGRLLPPSGENVPDTQFWNRRRRDGDVVAGMLEGEPLRLTAAEWARVPAIDPPSGPYTLGFAVAEAIHERDPAAPLLTHDEYLAETKA